MLFLILLARMLTRGCRAQHWVHSYQAVVPTDFFAGGGKKTSSSFSESALSPTGLRAPYRFATNKDRWGVGRTFDESSGRGVFRTTEHTRLVPSRSEDPCTC